MVTVSTFIRMVLDTTDNTRMIKSKGLDFTNGQIREDILAGGQKVSSTELGHLLTRLKSKQEKECGNSVIS